MRSIHNSDSIAKGSRDKLLDLLKNTYRVLLTRGLKGCHIFFEDREAADYVRSRIE
ncbi:MAG TPA: DNA/RNA helicase domain-containing protein [Candidatus Deferrimicrobium sp.]|nr:DNA/RNA helicase domain-containing protein [Candidatus Deferrimicrobium sp.]